MNLDELKKFAPLAGIVCLTGLIIHAERHNPLSWVWVVVLAACAVAWWWVRVRNAAPAPDQSEQSNNPDNEQEAPDA